NVALSKLSSRHRSRRELLPAVWHELERFRGRSTPAPGSAGYSAAVAATRCPAAATCLGVGGGRADSSARGLLRSASTPCRGAAGGERTPPGRGGPGAL